MSIQSVFTLRPDTTTIYYTFYLGVYMKGIIAAIILVSSLCYAAQYPPTGASLVNKRNRHEIYLGCLGQWQGKCHKASFILKKNGLEEIINEDIILIFDDSTEEFQRRWYAYNWLKMTASTSLNPIPYTSYIINMRRSSKLYLEAFKLMDRNSNSGDVVKLKNSYFKSMYKAIQALELD
jgi:hypothetical protein